MRRAARRRRARAGLGLGAGARGYSLGWRLAPRDPDAPEVSLGVKAARREGEAAKPEHAVGLELETKRQATADCEVQQRVCTMPR